MSDGAAKPYIEGDSMDNEQRTEVQFNQFELMDIGPSNDFQQFSFSSHDGSPVPRLDDISPSISWLVFSRIGHNITDTGMEQSIDDYQTTERPFASQHENEPVSHLIRVFPSIAQPNFSTHMDDEMQTNVEEMNYYPDTERPLTAHNGRYPMSNPTESFSSNQRSVGSTPAHAEMQTNFGEIGNYHQAKKRKLESHDVNRTEGSSSISQPMAASSTYNQSLTQNIIYLKSATEETTSIGFNFSPVVPLVEQQGEHSGDISSAYQPEQHKPNSGSRLVSEDGGNIHRAEQDTSNFETPSLEELIDADRASTSFGNLCVSAGPSSGWDLIEQCEPLGAQAHRRPEDKRFVCPACELTVRYWSNFSTHFRTHTNERPYPCNMCVRKFSSKGNLKLHRLNHHPSLTI